MYSSDFMVLKNDVGLGRILTVQTGQFQNDLSCLVSDEALINVRMQLEEDEQDILMVEL